MITLIVLGLCLISHMVVHGTVITINSDGSDNGSCCTSGNCPCSSLSSALHLIQNNTLITITSKSLTLDDIVEMGSGRNASYLTNITVIGNGVTIMCNNTGGVSCESCSDVIIMGITWHGCGHNDPKFPTASVPALNFTTISNMIIHSCIFQNSSGCPVYIKNAKQNITVEESYFTSNMFDASEYTYGCAGLHVHTERNNVSILINSSKFYSSGFRLSDTTDRCNHYGVVFILTLNCEVLNIIIDGTKFYNNSHGLYLDSGYTKSAIVKLSDVIIYNSSNHGILISVSANGNNSINVDVSFVAFLYNANPLSIVTPSNTKNLHAMINIENSKINGNTANDIEALDSYAKYLGVLRVALVSVETSVIIENCQFHNNSNGAMGIHVAPSRTECGSTNATITLTNVIIYNTTTTNDIRYGSIASVSIVTINTDRVSNQFTDVSFISNNYLRQSGEMLLIESSEVCDVYSSYVDALLTNCTFVNNTAFDRVVFLHINTNTEVGSGDAQYNTQLSECHFHNNFGGESIVYMNGIASNTIHSVMTVDNSTFSNNNGSALHIITAGFKFSGTIFFVNNTASSGAAIYFDEVHYVSSVKADVHFINNSVVQKGGALYFNLAKDYCNVFTSPFNASFINNLASIEGNSIYFSIPKSCQFIKNTSNASSLLYVPNKFNYFQSHFTENSEVITSPHSIELDVGPYDDYPLPPRITLGDSIELDGTVFDYFHRFTTESVTFNMNCTTCGYDYMLSKYQFTQYSNFKVLSKASSDVNNDTNISITLTSVLSPVYKNISVSFSVKLLPCRTGYRFDSFQKECVCNYVYYLHSDIFHCNTDGSVIKLGYWIGYIPGYHYALSICPYNYCNFVKYAEASPGYFYLPWNPDDQCKSHRTGIACSECKPGYTLAYNSPKCINKDNCYTRMTILVILLTVLYWIAIVAVVFGLMYLKFQISSGYAYGIIYYYSIVDILLDNNPYIFDPVVQAIAILSSFAKLTPQLFGQLCLVEGLSGIDQQFIHYSHAVGVSLILLTIVIVARRSPRLAMIMGRCIIRVICLLLLLAYTSIASTSLQLLRPLTFTEIYQVYTYSSPSIKYFTGRHLAYFIIAVLCEVILGIGLPLFLLLEPLLSRKISFVKVKPLLDQFQGCYKDKYRWFAAYYLICRQVIILIICVGNEDYSRRVYYLQTACIVIAMIHGWIQPYKNNVLNGLDEALLLIIVLVVNLNTFTVFTFSSSFISEISAVLIILPLLLLCFIAIKKCLSHCYNKKRTVLLRLHNPVGGNNGEDEENDNNHGNEANIRINENGANNRCNEFQEPLLDYSD